MKNDNSNMDEVSLIRDEALKIIFVIILIGAFAYFLLSAVSLGKRLHDSINRTITNSEEYEKSKKFIKESKAVVTKRWFTPASTEVKNNTFLIPVGGTIISIPNNKVYTVPEKYNLDLYCNEFNEDSVIDSYSSYTKYKTNDVVTVKVFRYKDGVLSLEVK